MRGDTSGIVVHPFFIPTTTGLGVNFHAGIRDSPTTVPQRAKYGQLTHEYTVEISKGNDACLKIQVFFYIATTSLYGRWFVYARQSLTRACLALNAAKLRFIPDAGRPPGFTEDVHDQTCDALPGHLPRTLHVLCRGRIRTKNDSPDREGISARAPGQIRFFVPYGVC